MVHSERTSNGPQVTGIVAVEDLVAGVESTQFTITEVFSRRTPRDPLVSTGAVPARLSALFERAGLDLGEHLGSAAS